MSENRKERRIEVGGLFMGALYGVMGLLCGAVIATNDRLVAGFAAFLLLLFLELIVHEAGHLLFGLATGYRFRSFRVASFLWKKEDGRIVCKRLSLAGTGGQCLMDPPEPEGETFPFVLYNLGGALMNLLTVPVFLLLYLLSRPDSLLSMAGLMGIPIAVTIAIANGLPLRLGAVNNDGRNLLDMLRSPAARRAFWLQLRISARTAENVQLKDMPEAWFPDPYTAPADNSLEAALPVLTCNRLLNQGKLPEARDAIQALLDRESAMVGLHRSLLICDLATCRLMEEDDAEDLLSSKAQKRFMKSMKNFPTVLRTEYVSSLLGKNDEKEAEEIRARFESLASTYPYPADILSERALMDRAEDIRRQKEETT